ncbi:hypothetical protein HAX54_013934 [Datura stramonium]|uniref:Uncharacterized protein n=1 Tax=Datura stramonium TaxID=4076 RepID=A0ABS8Y5Z6_DATST|nr:hypothetical protein [Datura stramonium]
MEGNERGDMARNRGRGEKWVRVLRCWSEKERVRVERIGEGRSGGGSSGFVYCLVGREERRGGGTGRLCCLRWWLLVGVHGGNGEGSSIRVVAEKNGERGRRLLGR